MSDDLERFRRLRPDQVQPDSPAEPTVFTRHKEQLMANITHSDTEPATDFTTADIYPRLAYDDEWAALEYLGRVFGLAEIREARQEHDDGHMLAWLRCGNGVVMIGHANASVHRILSPATTGATTIQMMVRVHDVDAHYARAQAAGADITVTLADAFYGERQYEATDLEGHRWHFGEPFDHIRARGGEAPDGDVAGAP